MIVCSLFGLPYSHGIIPQAPLHTRSLVVQKSKKKVRDNESRISVIENRISNLAQSGIIVASLSFIKVFGFIPMGVLIGMTMKYQSINMHIHFDNRIFCLHVLLYLN